MRHFIASLLALTAFPVLAHAGRGSSNAALASAIASNSPDAIVSEVERAEKLACIACIATVRPLLDHPDARVRDVAAWWLAKRGVRGEITNAAVARLQGGDPVLAGHGADALGRLADPATVPVLTTYLAKPLDENSGAAAAAALGKMGHPAAVPALQAAAVGGSSAKVRAAALRALRDVRGGSAAGPILPALADPDEEVRAQAVYTVGVLGDHAAVAPLMTAVAKDAAPSVRKHAAWALGQLGDATATAALTSAMTDADPLVRSMARVALSRLH